MPLTTHLPWKLAASLSICSSTSGVETCSIHLKSSMRTFLLMFYVRTILRSIYSQPFNNLNTPLSLLGPIVLLLLNHIPLDVCHNFWDSCSSGTISGVLPVLFLGNISLPYRRGNGKEAIVPIARL